MIFYRQYLASSLIDDDFVKEIPPNDIYFIPAVRQIEDAITDPRNFLVGSTAWRERFRADLEQYSALTSVAGMIDLDIEYILYNNYRSISHSNC